MVYSFARVSAVVNMRVEDYYRNGKRCGQHLQHGRDPAYIEQWQDDKFGVFMHWDPSCQMTGP